MARAGGGIVRGVERDHVVGDDVAQVLEPEGRQLRQDAPLVRNAGPEHVIERRDAIGGNDEEDVAGRVDVAHLAGAEALEARNVSVQNGDGGRHARGPPQEGAMLTGRSPDRVKNASRGTEEAAV